MISLSSCSQINSKNSISNPDVVYIPINSDEENEIRINDFPRVYIPTGAITENTKLLLIKLDEAKEIERANLIGQAIDISLEDGFLRDFIEIEFTVPSSITEHIQDDLYIAYYDNDNGWIELPSWKSDSQNSIVTFVNHLTIFGLFKSIHSDNAKIKDVNAYPNPYVSEGLFSCFDEDIFLEVDIDNPKSTNIDLEFQLEILTTSSGMVNQAVEFVANMVDVGLAIESGGNIATIPLAKALISKAEAQPQTIIASEWTKIDPLPDNQNRFYARIGLKQFTHCNENDWTKADGEKVGVTSIIEKFVVNIKLLDNKDSTKFESIEIPVNAFDQPYGDLISPGPSFESITGSRPTFTWNLNEWNTFDSEYKQELRVSKARKKWYQVWIRAISKNIDITNKEYGAIVPDRPLPVVGTIDQELEPGEYKWQIIMSKKDSKPTKSEIYYFTVIEDSLTIEVVKDGIVISDLASEEQIKDLDWTVHMDDQQVLDFSTYEQPRIIFEDLFHRGLNSGSFKVWLNSKEDGERKSNIVEFFTTNFIGMDINDVKSLLDKYGYNYEQISGNHEDCGYSVVFKQNPSPFTHIKDDEKITLYHCDDFLLLEDFSGNLIKNVKENLYKNGLIPIIGQSIHCEFSGSTEIVGDQYPKPGSKVRPPEEIILNPCKEETSHCSWQNQILGYWINTSMNPYNFLLFYSDGGLRAGKVVISNNIDYQAVDAGEYECLNGKALKAELDEAVFERDVKFSNNGNELSFYKITSGELATSWVRPELVHDLRGSGPPKGTSPKGDSGSSIGNEPSTSPSSESPKTVEFGDIYFFHPLAKTSTFHPNPVKVILVRATDNKEIVGGISDDRGNFGFIHVPEGKYYILPKEINSCLFGPNYTFTLMPQEVLHLQTVCLD